MLGLLLVTLAFSYSDRLALGLVLQDIKRDLVLTDTQLGLLTGLAFALFYSVMGVPLARWADRGDRVAIISATTLLSSAAVALCGAAVTFAQLLLARVAVAVGEAGSVPPAHSLIASHFTRAERPRAVGVYMLGGSLSVLVGYLAAGWLAEFFGWRAMFVLIAIPGIMLAALAWVLLQEPRRQSQRAHSGSASESDHSDPRSGADKGNTDKGIADQSGVADVFRNLLASSTFRHLLICFCIIQFFGYGIQKWQPTFFIRSFGLSTGELGTIFAVLFGLGGFVGTFLGGELSTRFAPANERFQLKLVGAAYAGFGLLSSFTYLSSDSRVAFGFLAAAAIGGGLTYGPLFATIQSLVPPNMRAMSIALLYFCGNLVGMGLGPLAAGLLSDALQPHVGEESVRYSLLIMCPGYVWGACHLWRASRTVGGDIAALAQVDR